jgi:hypothetical protein
MIVLSVAHLFCTTLVRIGIVVIVGKRWYGTEAFGTNASYAFPWHTWIDVRWKNSYVVRLNRAV